MSQQDRVDKRDGLREQDARQKRLYTTPQLVEYGSIARLTHTTGSTAREGSQPRRARGCL
jgi:hypothetical protein